MSLATSIASALSQMFDPLALSLTSADQLSALMRELGWTVEAVEDDVAAIAAILPVVEQVEALTTLVKQYQDGNAEAGDLVAQSVMVAAAVFDAIKELEALGSGGLSGLTAPLDDPDTWKELALELPEYLFLRWMRLYHPVAFALLVLGGVIEETAPATETLPARHTLHWDAFGALLEDPPAHLAEVYGWDATFDHARLLAAVGGVARALGVSAQRGALDETIAATHFDETPTNVLQLSSPIHRGWSADGREYVILDLVTAPVPSSGRGEPDGILITNAIVAGANTSIDLGNGWTLGLGGSVNATGALGVVLSPDGVKLAGGGAIPGVSLNMTGEPTAPWRLLGDGDGTRLELRKLDFGLAVEGSESAPELILTADATDGLALVIDPGEGDSFIADMLDAAPFEISGGFSVRWSSVDGFTLGGGIGLEVVIPVNLQAGPLSVDRFRVAVSAGSDGASAEVAVNGALVLGPFALVVEDIGLSAALVPRARELGPGDFGSCDVVVAFKPPTGLGVAIETTFASGGGFLSWDNETGEYAGILDAEVLGVGITAIGLLATRVEGADGQWSWYLSLAAKFTGIQLGFGFTLAGVGGLVGVNRALDIDALSAGIKDGALDAIMFPDDPIVEAPRILSQIGAIFPPAIGQYVFGPMVKIGWGTPSLITVDLGVIIQLPEPLTITLLGSLETVLPDAEVALLALHVDVAGTVNLTEGTLAIDAALRDSQLLGITLTGDSAVRARFLDDPSFCAAFGGFHPAFVPPENFPALRPLGFSIESGSNLRISLGCYFAVTSNSVQVGAEASLWASAAGFTVEGGISFDAMLTLSPFGFEIEMGFYASISAASVDLIGVYVSGALSGPTPWHVLGTATFKVLGFKQDIRIEATIGSSRPSARPSVDVLELALEALAEDGAWLEVLPEGTSDAVIFGEDAGDAVHPSAGLSVQQKIAPLDLTLEQYGNADVDGDTKLTLSSPTIGGAAAETSSLPVEDWFAIGHYLELSDAEKLSAPSFERMSCGLSFSSDAVSAPAGKVVTIGYEQIVRDPELGDDRPLDDVHNVSIDSLALGLAQSSAVKQRTRVGFASSASKPSLFALDESAWVAASTETGVIDATQTAAGHGSWAQTREVVRGNPALAVIPAYERESAT